MTEPMTETAKLVERLREKREEARRTLSVLDAQGNAHG